MFAFRRLLAALILVSLSRVAVGDAFVVPKAASATTIIEIFVEDDAIRLELEIGAGDIPYFRPLLLEGARQDIIQREKIADAPPPEKGAFELITIHADGTSLKPVIVRMESGKRLIRDEITGEPLPEQPRDAPQVVHLSLRYPFEGEQPRVLHFERTAPSDPSVAQASIGFVAYHLGLPVNDFRYFPDKLKLELSWEDAWYSAFHHPNFQRQNSAPLSAYLYIEPYEVRKEIVVRPRDLQRHLDLGLGNTGKIPVAMQEELKAKVAEFFDRRGKVIVDGREVTGTLDRIHFIKRTLRTTGIVDPPEDLALGSALLGVIYTYPVDALPGEVGLHWDLFDDLIDRIPSAATDEAGSLPTILTPQDPVLVWKNHLKNPSGSDLRDIDPPGTMNVSLPLPSAACFTLALGLGWRLKRRTTKTENPKATGSIIAIAAAVIIGVICWPLLRTEVPNPFSRGPSLAGSHEAKLVEGLLFNIYRSFDWRDKEEVFDRLSLSISGELLESVYLDTRRSIEIENQGGLQVNIREVDVLDLERLSHSSPRYHCRWRARGSVGHWGHVHQRENERSAELTLSAADGSWKIVAMNPIDEP